MNNKEETTMSKLSQSKKIAKYLQENINQRYSAKQIAQAITHHYPEDYIVKNANPSFETVDQGLL